MDTPTALYGIGVLLIFDDKFCSVLKSIGKPKVAAGGGEWTWPSSLSLPHFHSNLEVYNL